MSATTTPDLAAPRSPQIRKKGVNFEKVGWVYMRVSGVLLVVLIFGHLFTNLMVGDGIHALDWGFVAGKLANPFWQWWDILMLWLALIHGANGMRTIIADYTRKDSTKFWLNTLLALSMAFTLVLGTYVLLTFDASIS